MPIKPDELVSALSQLPAEQLQALVAKAQGGNVSRSGTPRISASFASIDEAKAGEVIAACREGLAAAATKAGDAAELASIEPLERCAPMIASAARTNSNYRGKSLSHSVRTIEVALSIRFPRAEAKHAEAAAAAKQDAQPNG